jgi:hypothetical protein
MRCLSENVLQLLVEADDLGADDRLPFGLSFNVIVDPHRTSILAAARISAEHHQCRIIEDQRDIREGLGILIGGTVGYRVVGSFGSMEEALPHVAKKHSTLRR